MSKPTAVTELLHDLNAGVFAEQVAQALSDVALGVVTQGRQGSVTLTFNMKRIGESSQIAMVHALKFTKPTRRGKASEEMATETPLHVGVGGVLSLFPHQSEELFPRTERAE